MTRWTLIRHNAFRSRLRCALTLAAVAVNVSALVLLRTVVDAWNSGAEYAAKDRLSTRNRISYGQPLPRRYLDEIRERVPGVVRVTHCDWFGGRWAKQPSEFFANLACADDAFEVYPEISVAPAALERWKRDRQGAIIGDRLARKLGLRVGDRMTLEGTFYPGDWELTIDGIYSAGPRSGVDRSTLFFRWDYKNDRVPPARKEEIGWVFTRVDEPARSAEISRAIDRLFEDREVQTLTMSERAANTSFLGTIGALFGAIDLVSLSLLLIVGLLLANTFAMNVRERRSELGVLRALGFSASSITRLLVAEAVLVAGAGAALGLALSFLWVELQLAGWLELNFGKFFPAFRIAPRTFALTQAGALALGALAAWLPARRAVRTPVSQLLRQIA